MNAKIVVADLTKNYGPMTAVDSVSFEVPQGTIFGLLGPNGAGKTSVLECLAGLRQPDGGCIHLDGVDALAEPTRARVRIGVSLQETALQDRITPREALRLFGAFYPAAIAPEALLDRFSLENKADAPYESLSGGQKQRLALALALVNQPDILLLDEPAAGLDPQARRELHQLILRLRDEGRTVFLATHYMDEAHFLCERLAILRNGRIVAQGRPDELIARSPALAQVTLRTSMPAAVANFLAALAGISRVESAGDEVRFLTGNVGRSVSEAVGLLQREGGELLDLQTSRPSLEDTFIDLTGDPAA